MSPRKQRAAILATDDGEPGDAVSISEAEAEALKAETRAESARAKAYELRRTTAKERRRSRRPIVAKAAALVVAVALCCAAITLTVLMLLSHRAVTQQDHRAAEFKAAARQGVVTMMTLDPAKAKENLQSVLDNATGQFKKDLQGTAAFMIANTQRQKVSTTIDVRSVAIESMTDNSAVVLVAATSDIKDPDNTKRPQATWRVAVTVQRDGDQIKMSKFEFV